MGWSCSAEADDTMQVWTKACLKSTGSQNTWKERGKTYFFEASRLEHNDGAITGKILEIVETRGDDIQCRVAGSFRISGDGQVARAPKFLVDAANEHRILSGGRERRTK